MIKDIIFFILLFPSLCFPDAGLIGEECLTPSGGGCATQSVLLDQTDTYSTNTTTMYTTDGNTEAFAITGDGNALYSIKLRTGSLMGGTAPDSAKLYINTSLDFSGTNVDEQLITNFPSTSNTEFIVELSSQPALTNSTIYYVAIYDPACIYGERFTLTLIADVAGDNRYLSTTGLAGTYNQQTNQSIWAEVKVCD